MKFYLTYTLILVFAFTGCKKDSAIIFSQNISSTGDDESAVSPPATVYVSSGGDTGIVYAINAIDGTLKWKYIVGAGFNFAGIPCLANGVLYVEATSPSYILYAFDANTGSFLWNRALRGSSYGPKSSPTYASETIYVGAGQILNAVNALNGKIKWSLNTNSGRDNYFSSGTVVNGVLYICSRKALYAINPVTGSIIWQHADAITYASSPAVSNGSIVYLNDNFQTVALDTAGNIKWTHPFAVGGGSYFSATINNGICYSVARSNDDILHTYSINNMNGAGIWEHTQHSNANNGDPFYVNNSLYLNLGDSLLALNTQDGNRKWSCFLASLNEDYFYNKSSPCGNAKIMYVGGDDKYLYAIATKTGTVAWKFYTGGVYYASSPVVLNADGSAIHPSTSGMSQ